jgi:hypothetical protein
MRQIWTTRAVVLIGALLLAAALLFAVVQT